MRGLAAIIDAALALAMPVAAKETAVPHIASKAGRHALIVDGAPFLMLAAQVNNSSAWPAAMANVWPTMEALHVNAALPGDPFKYQDPRSYASGGPANTVIDVYKAAAPHLDVLAPDIYNADHGAYLGFLDAYDRPDNPLMVPETGHEQNSARYFFAAMGCGAIGWAPFGVDGNRYTNRLPVTPRIDTETIAPFAHHFGLFRPIARLWAKLAFAGKTWGAAEPNDPADQHVQTMKLGRYVATASFGRGDFGDASPKGNPDASGGVAIAELGADEYLVTGFRARVDFALADPAAATAIYDRIEEGHYDAAGRWVFERVWNGDQADWGLNFTAAPQMLRVRLGSYPTR